MLRAGANAAFEQLPISPSINRILNRTGIFVLSQPGTQHKVSSLGELLLQVPCTREFVAAAMLVAATSCRRCKTHLALCNLDENLQFVLKAQLQKNTEILPTSLCQGRVPACTSILTCQRATPTPPRSQPTCLCQARSVAATTNPKF